MGSSQNRLVLVFGLTISCLGMADRSGVCLGQRQLSSYLVDTKTAWEQKFLTQKYDIERRVGNKLEVILPFSEAKAFTAMFPQAELEEKDIHDVFVRNTRANSHWRDGYHTFDTVQSELRTLAGMNPAMVTLENYGNSDDGQPLLAVGLTGTARGNKTELLITSSTHGNEIATVEVTMAMIQKMVAGYGKDARITAMMDKHIIYFIPVLSPDGYVAESREIHGVDPNRDYPWPDDAQHQPIPTIANEMKWFATHKFVGSIDIHSPAEMIMYPWAYTAESPKSDDLSRFKAAADPIGQILGFPVGQIYEIIYPAPGSSADYWYWKHQTLALAMEMSGGGFAPDSSELPGLIEKHVPALYQFVEAFQ